MNKFIILSFLFMNIFVINLFQLPFRICKNILPRKVTLWAIKFTKRAFSEVIMLLGLFAPYKLYISGANIFDESAVIISNHSSFLDWFYIWNFVSYFEDGSILKTILKYDLKNIPIIGRGMEFFEFIFLKRKFSEDEEQLMKSLDKISKDNEKFWLLLFPEGTIIGEETKKISDEYALKNNLIPTKGVLIPKTTGLGVCLKKLLKDVGCIYDLTIGYKNIPPDTKMDSHEIVNSIFFDKTCSPEIHIHVDRIPIQQIYKKLYSDEFNKFVYDLFYEKDKKIEFFKSKGYFCEDHHRLESSQMIRESSNYKNLIIIWMFWIFIKYFLLWAYNIL